MSKSIALTAPDTADFPGPKHTFFAPCTPEQQSAYASIDYALAHGLLARRIYVLGVQPIAPTGYALIVLSGDDTLTLAELSLLFPGVAAWEPFDAAKVPLRADALERTVKLLPTIKRTF